MVFTYTLKSCQGKKRGQGRCTLLEREFEVQNRGGEAGWAEGAELSFHLARGTPPSIRANLEGGGNSTRSLACLGSWKVDMYFYTFAHLGHRSLGYSSHIIAKYFSKLCFMQAPVCPVWHSLSGPPPLGCMLCTVWFYWWFRTLGTALCHHIHLALGTPYFCPRRFMVS